MKSFHMYTIAGLCIYIYIYAVYIMIQCTEPATPAVIACSELPVSPQEAVHTTWCLMDRSDSSRKPRSRTVVKGLTKAHRHSAHWCRDGYTVCGSHTTGSQ